MLAAKAEILNSFYDKRFHDFNKFELNSRLKAILNHPLRYIF